MSVRRMRDCARRFGLALAACLTVGVVTAAASPRTLQRRLTTPTPDVEFIPLEWSADGSQVLTFRSAPDRLASVGGAWSTVRSNGQAQPGAWYKPPGSL